jgi:hypothetical protein
MNKQIIYSTFLALSLSACAMAQSKDAPKEKKSKVEEEVVVINDGGKGTEKMTVRVDGNKVTINGKDVDSFKDSDWEKLGNKKVIIDMHGKNGFVMNMPPMEFNNKDHSMKMGKGNFEIRIPNFEHNFNFDENVMKGGPGNVRIMSSNGRPKLGMQIEDLEAGDGVKVTDVDDDLPAGKAGLKEDDIITEVNGKNVKSVDELRDQIKDLKPGDAVKLGLKRGGKAQTLELKIPKKLKSANL